MVIDFVKGILIGIALVLPGLSGSMFAVVVGLYEKIIFAVNDLRKAFKKNAWFLLPIVVGAVVGIFLSTKLIMLIYERWPMYTSFFFIGLVLGCAPLILRRLQKKKFNPLYLLIGVVALGVVILLAPDKSLPQGEAIAVLTVQNFFLLFVAGLVSCSAMSIPGLSGSVTLMILGQFNTVYKAVGDLNVLIILPFFLGALAGLVIMAKLLAFVLSRFEVQTYYAVAGLLIGSVYVLYPGFEASLVSVLIGLACVVVGYVCAVFFDKEPETEKTAKLGD